MTGLSDFDVMWARLVNWGRWGRQDSCRPDPESVTSSIYSLGRANRQGEGDDEGPADDQPTPIDHKDAEAVDRIVVRLAIGHRVTIKRAFYLRTAVYRPTLDEAIRAACDADA